MDRGLSSSQLTNASNQFSPRDLFTAIPDNEKGGDCNGKIFISFRCFTNPWSGYHANCSIYELYGLFAI